ALPRPPARARDHPGRPPPLRRKPEPAPGRARRAPRDRRRGQHRPRGRPRAARFPAGLGREPEEEPLLTDAEPGASPCPDPGRPSLPLAPPRRRPLATGAPRVTAVPAPPGSHGTSTACLGSRATARGAAL